MEVSQTPCLFGKTITVVLMGKAGLGQECAIPGRVHGALQVPPPVILSFSLQTVQPGHHHQNLLGRKVGNTHPPAEQTQVRFSPQALTHLSFSRAETERGLSRKHIIEGRGRGKNVHQGLLAPVPGCASPSASLLAAWGSACLTAPSVLQV